MRLRQLEAESIEILRELSTVFSKTVLLYSVGKDSSVLLKLAQKAFAPGEIPFPVMHIDTGFKFKEMYEFRDRVARAMNLNLVVERNQAAIERGASPFAMGTHACCG